MPMSSHDGKVSIVSGMRCLTIHLAAAVRFSFSGTRNPVPSAPTEHPPVTPCVPLLFPAGCAQVGPTRHFHEWAIRRQGVGSKFEWNVQLHLLPGCAQRQVHQPQEAYEVNFSPPAAR